MIEWRRTALLSVVLSTIAVAGVLGYRHLEVEPKESATAIELARLDGPGSARLSDWHGTPIVVNLFASWCPACLAEMPAFEKASHEYAGRIVIVGVDSQDSPEAGLSLARQLGITYPLVADTSRADLYTALHGQGMPVTAFIGRDGSVKQTYSGKLDSALLTDLIEQLLIPK